MMDVVDLDTIQVAARKDVEDGQCPEKSREEERRRGFGSGMTFQID